MKFLIALLFPWLSFFIIGRPFAAMICLFLQVTLLGWLPAAIWAVHALLQDRADQEAKAALYH